MKIHTRKLRLALCLALISTIPGFTQTSEESSGTPSASVAHVYVQTARGVMAFSAQANGKLTPIGGAPFGVSGQMGAASGKYLFVVGTNELHTYSIKSSGAVGAKIFDTDNLDDLECAAPNTGSHMVLDPTGKRVYMTIDSSGMCGILETLQVGSNGHLQVSAIQVADSCFAGYCYASTPPTISNVLGYGVYPGANSENFFAGYQYTNATEGLEIISFTVSGPKGNPTFLSIYYPALVEADHNGHLASAMYLLNGQGKPDGAYELASFSINSSSGDIDSTNSWSNMPTLAVGTPYTMNSSPSGTLLAVGGQSGLQVFHFNGAAPLTQLTGTVLSGVDVDQVKWDKDNHLYALSYGQNLLYVFNVTPTSFSEASGSPYHLPGNAYGDTGLVVVPN